MIIDSGTTSPHLDTAAYKPIIDSLKSQIKASPAVDTSLPFELCYRRCRERGDRGVEEVSTEIGNQRREKWSIEQARLCSRSAARSTGGEGRSAARSAGVHNVHKVSPVDRPVDRGRERSTGPVDRLTGLSSQLGPVDRRSTVAWVSRPAGRPTCTF